MRLPITADKRLRFTSSKLPLATSFIRKTLCEIIKVWPRSVDEEQLRKYKEWGKRYSIEKEKEREMEKG